MVYVFITYIAFNLIGFIVSYVDVSPIVYAIFILIYLIFLIILIMILYISNFLLYMTI